jgi:hypothetical protein
MLPEYSARCLAADHILAESIAIGVTARTVRRQAISRATTGSGIAAGGARRKLILRRVGYYELITKK